MANEMDIGFEISMSFSGIVPFVSNTAAILVSAFYLHSSGRATR